MDIIIVGNGKMGFSLADQLASEDHSITIVDTHEAALRRASDTLDVMSVKGNGVSAAVLREAGAEHADLLIAATSTDEVNMVCCLTAKKMGTSYTIARIRNQEYTSGLAELKRDLGIDMVINPENATAVEISRLLRFPSAANIETFCRGRVELMGFRLMEEDFLVGNPLQDLSSQVKKLSLLFCAVDRDGEVIIPNGSFVPQAGDNLYLIGRPTGLDQFFRLLGRYTPKVRRVFLVGGGKISLYLAILLEKMQMQVKIVELSEARCRFLSELLPHSTIICGDGTDQELLDSENLSSCDAFVALTDRDEDNLIISLYAAQLGLSKVITKSNRQNYNRYRPGRWSGQHHLSQAAGHLPHSPGGPGDAELPGQRDERSVPHRGWGRRGHGVYRHRLHPPSGHAPAGPVPEARYSGGRGGPGRRDHYPGRLHVHPRGRLCHPHLPRQASSGSQRHL